MSPDLEGGRHNFQLKVIFTFTNSVDPDEMQHYAEFHMDLHCLQKYLFRVFLNTCILGNSNAFSGNMQFFINQLFH